jgi:hypothetical protein
MKTHYLLLLFTLCGLTSFAQTSKPKCYYTRYDRLNKNNQTTAYYVYLNDAQKRRIGLEYYKPNGTLKFYFKDEFNEKGKVKKRTWYNTQHQVTKYIVHQYNDEGLETSHRGFLADHSEDYRREYHYNEQKKLVKMEYFHKKKLFDYMVYTYLKNGKLDKFERRLTQGKVKQKYSYEYNAKGKKVKYNIYNKKGELTGYYSFTYDQKDMMTHQTYYLASGEKQFTKAYQYKCVD